MNWKGDILPPVNGCGLPFWHSSPAFIPPINGVGFLLGIGKPLVSYEFIINLLNNVKTKTGLRISAKMDRKEYQKGKRITEEELEKIKITLHETNPQWNYTIG